MSAGMLLGCASDRIADTSNADASGSSSESGGGSSESEGGSETDTGDTGGPSGCTVTSGCADDEFCDFPDGLCGAVEPGTCVPRPSECGGQDFECGCDDLAYETGCAAMSGIDTSDIANCTPPHSNFPCGDMECYSGTHYCEHLYSDVIGVPDYYWCTALPDECGFPIDCECLLIEDGCPVGTCGPTGSGFTIDCSGG